MEARQGTNLGLHLIRGLCALGVAAYHYLSWTHGIAIESAGAFLVYVFFVLSALTLMMVHAEEFSRGIEFQSLVAFYRKRVARILPLLMAVSLFGGLIGSMSAGYVHIGTLARVYLTGSTLFGLHMPGLISGVVAAWSLGIEAVFYLVFPVLALLACNVRLRTIIIAAILLIAAQQSAILLIRGEKSPTFWFHYANPLVFSPFFAIGIIIYFRPLQVRAINFWLSLVALLAIAGFSLLTSVNVYTNPLVYLFLTALTGASVLTAYSATVPAWTAPVGKFLGNISYALYLTHWFSYRASGYVASKLGLDMVRPLIFALIALSVAYLLFRFFELPMKAWLRGDRSLSAGRPVTVA